MNTVPEADSDLLESTVVRSMASAPVDIAQQWAVNPRTIDETGTRLTMISFLLSLDRLIKYRRANPKLLDISKKVFFQGYGFFHVQEHLELSGAAVDPRGPPWSSREQLCDTLPRFCNSGAPGSSRREPGEKCGPWS